MATLMHRSTELPIEASVKTEVYSILISFTVISALAVFFRLWARYRCTKFYGWDDWLIVVALFLCFVRLAHSIVMLEAGLGWQTDLAKKPLIYATIAKTLFSDEGLYILVLGVIKIAVLIMYYRVFPLRGFQIATWVVGGAVVAWTVGFIILWCLQCMPIIHLWDPTTPGTCLDLRIIVIVNTIPRMLLDVTILAMPVCQVWKLQMPKAQKIGLTCIFLLGSFVLVPSIWRLVVVVKEKSLASSESLKSLNMWSYIEACVALISACLPTIRPLLTAFSGLTSFGWSRNVREEGRDSSETDVPSGEKSKQGSDATRRMLLLDQSSDSDFIIEQEGPCKGMVVRAGQIPKAGVSSEDIQRSNENMC